MWLKHVRWKISVERLATELNCLYNIVCSFIWPGPELLVSSLSWSPVFSLLVSLLMSSLSSRRWLTDVSLALLLLLLLIRSSLCHWELLWRKLLCSPGPVPSSFSSDTKQSPVKCCLNETMTKISTTLDFEFVQISIRYNDYYNLDSMFRFFAATH